MSESPKQVQNAGSSQALQNKDSRDEFMAIMGGEEGLRQFLQDMLPWLLCDLLDSGKIDESRLDDPVYLLGVLRSNTEWFRDRPAVVLMDDEFIDAARDALERGRIGAAVVLVATAIEHHLNHHLRFVLGRDSNLSESQITSVIKNNNLPAKIDWLIELVTGQGLSKELSQRITQINEMRNSVVHYKFVPVNEQEPTQLERVYTQAKQFGFDKLLATPTDLQRELGEIEIELFPNVKRASVLVEEMLDGIEKIARTNNND